VSKLRQIWGYGQDTLPSNLNFRVKVWGTLLARGVAAV
jgi:hypothetical protein